MPKPCDQELQERFMPLGEWNYGDAERLMRRLYLDTAISFVAAVATMNRCVSVALTELEGSMLWAINAVKQ